MSLEQSVKKLPAGRLLYRQNDDFPYVVVRNDRCAELCWWKRVGQRTAMLPGHLRRTTLCEPTESPTPSFQKGVSWDRGSGALLCSGKPSCRGTHRTGLGSSFHGCPRRSPSIRPAVSTD